MKSDVEVTRAPAPIKQIAADLGLRDDEIICFGQYKAKIRRGVMNRLAVRPDAKLVLVTAVNPTPAGEGKTTITVGLGDAFRQLGQASVITLREPSLGPVFGMKGGAAGGGRAQVIPMEDINLHFTGDFHAIGAANNLLAALLDNHVYQGNALHINPKRIVWRRVLDMNDRQLRCIVDGLGGRANGVPREDGFDITAASEIMAVFCLSRDLLDLKRRLSQMVVAYDREEAPVTVKDLKAEGALTALLNEAFHPNLVQSLEGTPALIHGGPFANIAHGCNSLIATSMAMRLGGIVITEAGFGADLGAEKFLDIKCRAGGLWPDAVVVVATARALKHHGGCAKDAWGRENIEALKAGMENLKKHLENLTHLYRLPVVVGINRFPGDTLKELDCIREFCHRLNVPSAISEVFEKGGGGGIELAEKVRMAMEGPRTPLYAYRLDMALRRKIEVLAQDVYGARDVVFSKEAESGLRHIEAMGYGHLPICMAKTQFSLSDDAALLARPAGFTLTVRQVRLLAGAGFVVALTGEILTMPGLPRTPAAERIEVDAEGRISGLF